MNIAYCTNVRLPSERAHGHQIAQVCDALNSMGHNVTIFAPHRRNPVTQDFHTYYGAHANVKIRHVGSFDPINRPWLPGVTGLWTLNALLGVEYVRHLSSKDFDLVYTRTPALLPVLLASGIPVILELHQLPRFRRKRFTISAMRCRLVVCLTSAMRDALISWGVPSSKIIVEGDGVDLRRFAAVPSKEQAREEISLSTDRFVVGYVGRLKTLGMEKGVLHLLEALKQLQKTGRFMGLIVGGPAHEMEEYRAKAQHLGLTEEDVRFTGEVPAKTVPAMLSACDALTMPFPDLPHYRHHMSPLKMFEYMAAERPLITSDLPTVRDVLSEQQAFFCTPGDAQSLASAIQRIEHLPDDARARTAAARILVNNHTWEKRMFRILGAASLAS